MGNPLIQIGDVVRPMTDEEFEAYKLTIADAVVLQEPTNE